MGVTEGDPQARRQEQSPETFSWISTKRLGDILRDLHIPTPLQERILGRAKNEAAKGVIAEIDPKVADEYLREVTQKVFSFSLHDLSTMELRQIEEIRERLSIPGKFELSAY